MENPPINHNWNIDPSEEQYWNDLEGAIRDVEALAYDDKFEEVLEKFAVHKISTFNQGEDELCLYNNEQFQISDLTKYIDDRIINIEDTGIIYEYKDGQHNLIGSTTINNQPINFYTENGQMWLKIEDGMPLIPTGIDDVTRFLLTLSSNYLDTKRSNVESIVSVFEQPETTDEDRLHSTISQMGNLLGSSSHTTGALMPASDGGIVVKLTTYDTPNHNGLDNRIKVFKQPKDAFMFPGEIGTTQHDKLLEDSIERENHTAYRALSTDSFENLEAQANNEEPLETPPGALLASYTETSPPEEVQEYAKLCKELLESYEKIIQEQL